MNHDDFKLTHEELARINRHLAACAEAYVGEKENPATSVSIIFEFVVNFGRSISVNYGGQVTPTVVIDFAE